MRVVRRLLDRYLEGDVPKGPVAAFTRRRMIGVLATMVLAWDRARDVAGRRGKVGPDPRGRLW